MRGAGPGPWLRAKQARITVGLSDHIIEGVMGSRKGDTDRGGK